MEIGRGSTRRSKNRIKSGTERASYRKRGSVVGSTIGGDGESASDGDEKGSYI